MVLLAGAFAATQVQARWLGACVSLLSKDAAVSRIEDPDSGTVAADGRAVSRSETLGLLERFTLDISERDSMLEIVGSAEASANPLARAAARLKNDPVFRTANFPDGLRLVVDPALQTSDGYFSVETGEIHLAANVLHDPALAYATVAHEMVHAEQFSLWFKATTKVSPINTVAKGELPGLEGSRYAAHVSAQEMPAFSIGKHIYEKYGGALHPEMVRNGMQISKSFLQMTSDILTAFDGLSKNQLGRLLVTNFRTIALADGQQLNVEYHIGRHSNVKSESFYASVKVLKKTHRGFREYRLEVPLPGDTLSMTADVFFNLMMGQVRMLRDYSTKYIEIYR